MIDEKDATILVALSKAGEDGESPSIEELSEKLKLSKTAIYARLQKLEYWNLLQQPEKGRHRSRKLTTAGIRYLEQNGLYNK